MKPIWSAFALSLILLISSSFAQNTENNEFMGLEREIMPDLLGAQRFTTRNLHQGDSSWSVDPSQVEFDLPHPGRGQNYSIIPWSSQTPEDLLSIQNWISERDLKDKIPDWKIRLRQAYQTEKMGVLLQCRGECFIYRGANRAKGQHLSQIFEGDELMTEKDSVAWVYLLDGTLLRLAPDSSLAFQEINLKKDEFFFLTRLNFGHVFLHSRQESELSIDEDPETDSFSLPLMIKEANLQYFERLSYQKDQAIAQAWPATLGDFVIRQQVEEVNRLRKLNLASIPIYGRHMMVTANMTLLSKGSSYDLSFFPGGKSYLKKRTSQDVLSFQMRGYKAMESVSVTDTLWYSVGVTGREFSKEENVPAGLQILELLTKRIRTIELARELWLQRFTLPVFLALNDQEKLARDHGFKLWGQELENRISFLFEYTRRVETTHLRSLDNLVSKLEAKGEKVFKEVSLGHYEKSLSHYLLGLKSRHDDKANRVKEMSDLQYYVWILRHGKY
jgi:hypothetical protein